MTYDGLKLVKMGVVDFQQPVFPIRRSTLTIQENE